MIPVKKQLIPAVALSCILLGCSGKNTPAETTTSSMATTVQTTSTTTSSTSETTVNSTEASSEETTVTEATTQAQAASGMADLSLGYDIIVNKKHALPSTYAPGEDPTAGQQVRALIHRMQELGYPISDTYSGYRSYDYQTELYNNYVAREGKAAADTYSARLRYSRLSWKLTRWPRIQRRHPLASYACPRVRLHHPIPTRQGSHHRLPSRSMAPKIRR
mgnify:CR=1 FL=1